ncbi:hypothetical protein RBG61_13020 [Paludicola sp. MB14-C6]|uniref:hypothetical protein n=1 Tax=Paludihabitans sp. MB14-C6 TaxID=3070656 RepID=UPI0027DE2D60|nr:hypothetical protein [Paludicola sp. MB14-C6]WMJ22895.1 hypothetical protein RBG61_13020 [Paludicola sp. MB14-C6]
MNEDKIVNSDIYILIPCVLKNSNVSIVENEHTKLSNVYIQKLQQQSKYECSNNICSQLTRKFLGEYGFACTGDNYADIEKDGILNDGHAVSFEEVQLVLTEHYQTGLFILTIIIPQNKHEITFIEDQISTDHIYLSNSSESTYRQIDMFLLDECGIVRIDNPKCIVCLPKKPDEEKEFHAMLAGEAYRSEYVNYNIKSNQLKEIADNNIAQYDFYEAYVSSSCLIYIFNDFSNSYINNLDNEIAIIFICELILFQNAAISRTNQRIVTELTSTNKISLKNIEELYTEFGKTINFWNINNFKYILPQNLSNSIAKAFKTPELLESYYRNLSHLEHIVELHSSQSAERESKVINVIAILLAVIQIIPLLIELVSYLNKADSSIIWPIGIVTSSLISSLILIVIAKRLNARRRKRKGIK